MIEKLPDIVQCARYQRHFADPPFEAAQAAGLDRSLTDSDVFAEHRLVPPLPPQPEPPLAASLEFQRLRIQDDLRPQPKLAATLAKAAVAAAAAGSPSGASADGAGGEVTEVKKKERKPRKVQDLWFG